MKMISIIVLNVALAGCAINQGTPSNTQASRAESCKATSERRQEPGSGEEVLVYDPVAQFGGGGLTLKREQIG